MPTTYPTGYATDEDVALRASKDFALLCPRDQKLAAGTDGAFVASDRWTLRSSTVDFAGQGLAAGQIVLLSRPASHFSAPGEAFVVVSTAPQSVLLRRKGQPQGIGQPPGPAVGLSGIEFAACTFSPQIERASADLDRRFGIDALLDGRRPADLYDRREIRDAVVLTVLHQQYLDASREAGNDGDVFAEKARRIKGELDELLARAVVRWSPAGIPTTRFSTRISR